MKFLCVILLCLCVSGNMTRTEAIDKLKYIDKASPTISDERLELLEPTGKPRDVTTAELEQGLKEGTLVIVRRSTLRKIIKALDQQVDNK